MKPRIPMITHGYTFLMTHIFRKDYTLSVNHIQIRFDGGKKMQEDRWNVWLMFSCANYFQHPDALGIAVLTNYSYIPRVTASAEVKACSLCGSVLVYTGKEDALLPFLTHDFDRLREAGYNPIKDEELWVADY
jgi:hypothetical protein